VGVAVVAVVAGFLFVNGRSDSGGGTTRPTLADGSPAPTFRDGSPVPTLLDGTPESTLPNDPRNLGRRRPRPTTTLFVASREKDPEASWGPVANCPKAEAARPAVMIAQLNRTDGAPVKFDRAIEVLKGANVSTSPLERLGEAHWLGSVAVPGTVGDLMPQARRLVAQAPRADEAPVIVEMHCEGHTRSDGTITLVLRESADPDAVVYRNGFADTVDHTRPLRDGRGAALWNLKTTKAHTVRRTIAYLRDHDVLAAYPGGGCPLQNGDPKRPIDCGLRVSA